MKIERGTGAASTSYKRPTIACIVFHDPSESHPFHVTFEDGTNAWVRTVQVGAGVEYERTRTQRTRP